MRGSGLLVPRSSGSCPSPCTSSRTRSRSLTPRWSNPTATRISRLRYSRMDGPELWRELAQQLRVDAVRASAKAGSGHPTSSMSAADLAAVLLAAHFRYDLDDPKSPANDRIVFSKGHASPLVYGLFRVWVICGDSEMAEGSMWEALEHAAFYELDNLTAIIDVNRLGQRGETMHGWDLASYSDRLRAFGWHAIEIDGHDVEAI